MKTVITPIGTSLITNYIDEFLAEKEDRDINEKVREIYNDICNNENIEKDDLNSIENNLEVYLKDYPNSCAERKSIEEIKRVENDIKIILIISETQISKYLGEIFKNYFGENCETKEIEGLQIDDKERFENEGLHNFIEFFKTLNKKELIFNITAGYKVFIPYLTIIGQIYSISIKYIFENSNSLISIPELPTGFDDEMADLYLPYLYKDGLKLLKSNNDIKDELERYGFITLNNTKISITPLGELFRDYMHYKKTYLGIIIEFLISDLFIKNGQFPKKGETYLYNENNKEKIGEIDLILEKDDEIEFFEIKSLGAYKERQLKRHIDFIDNYHTTKRKTLTIFFYLLDEKLLRPKKSSFKKIKEENENVNFRVKYIKVKPKKFQNFVREFKDKEIKEFNYE